MDAGYSSSLNKSSCLNNEQTGALLACLNPFVGKNDPKPELEYVALRVIATREALDYVGWGEQARFAKSANLKNNRLNQWEKARVRPPESGLRELRRAHGVPPDWIWYGDSSNLPRRIYEKIPSHILNLPAEPVPAPKATKPAPKAKPSQRRS